MISFFWSFSSFAIAVTEVRMRGSSDGRTANQHVISTNLTLKCTPTVVLSDINLDFIQVARVVISAPKNFHTRGYYVFAPHG